MCKLSDVTGITYTYDYTFSMLDVKFSWVDGMAVCAKRFRIDMISGRSIQCLISRLREMADNIDAAFKEK